ncbi:hypothetical protein IYO2065_26820 [Lactiplantibacillus plantarum]|nr:hypothetical protein IYO2065_26820 [Lactiplantibacillus plantarum]
MNWLNYPIGIETTIGIMIIIRCVDLLHTTTQNKYRMFDEAIRNLNLKPDNRVLDLGCSRRALLIRIAKQLRPACKVNDLDL